VRFLISIIFLLFSLSMCAQTVADAAKAKPTKKARHVITNDDIPSRPEPEPESAPAAKADASTVSTPSPAASDEQKTDTTAAEPKKEGDAADDSDPVKMAQKKVDELKARIESIQQQITDTDKKLETASDDRVRDALKSARDGKTEFVEDLKKQLAAAEKDLETARNSSGKQSGDTAESKPPADQQ